MRRDPAFQKPTAEAGQVCGAQRRGFRHRRANDRRAENVGLKLHEAVVGGGPAIHAKFRHRCAGIAPHRIQQVGDLIGNALERCAGEVACGGAAGESKDRAARVGVPMGRAQSHEGRDEKYAAIVRNGLGQRLDFFGSSNQTQSVAQPLDDCAADEDAALEGVLGHVSYFPGDGCDQPIRGWHGARAGVLQHEASGAVGILGQARAECIAGQTTRLADRPQCLREECPPILSPRSLLRRSRWRTARQASWRAELETDREVRGPRRRCEY